MIEAPSFHALHDWDQTHRDMDQEVYILTFFQGRLKARNQLCWQILDKANRIGQRHLQIAC